MIKAFSRLFCPQSAIHGWSGLAIDPTTYLLLEGTVFVIPIDPGAMAVYSQWAAPTTVKMIDATFLQDKNYLMSYKNIARACSCMFDANITAQFKVSNTPSLTGWNSMMSVNVIFDQLQDSYGKPNMLLFNSYTLFRSPMTPTDLPKMLFYRIKQCQEIQHIEKTKIIASAVRILFQANIFPLRDFDTWEASATKTYPALKTFFHEAYGQRLSALALRSTSGQMCWKATTTPMRNEDMVTAITQTTAATTTTGTTPMLGWPSMWTLPQQSTSYLQIKWPSCCRWGQCC
jgi:hypothetical protein